MKPSHFDSKCRKAAICLRQAQLPEETALSVALAWASSQAHTQRQAFSERVHYYFLLLNSTEPGGSLWQTL